MKIAIVYASVHHGNTKKITKRYFLSVHMAADLSLSQLSR